LVQALVYIFIAVAAAGVGAAAYFGLTFTPADAILTAVVFGAVCVVVTERTLRQRAEQRLEGAIEDLSRLLATDAQAGAVLGQRVNAMADLNAGARLEGVEADISVLGTVIRQVAEAVAEIEERATAAAAPVRPAPSVVAAAATEPRIPVEAVRRALAENRIVHHVQPVVKLPQRRPQGFDLVPRLLLDNGELVESIDFLPRRGSSDILRHIEAMGMSEAIAISRRAMAAGHGMRLYIPLSRATLGDANAAEQLGASLEANRAVASGLVFAVHMNEWLDFTTPERALAQSIVRRGASFSLLDAHSLRLDVGDLATRGVRSLRIDAAEFIARPERFTDFHPSDIADYVSRFELELLATGIENEAQIVELLDSGIRLAQGPYIAPSAPVRPDLGAELPKPTAPLRRAEV
jgi:cyclic-di-GMP phosphodiesterase TipF (flagellum assembly factor)